LWNLWYTTIPAPDQLDAEISRRLGLHQQGAMVPFSVIEKTTNKAVGVTTYMNIDAANRRLEIGATWYRKRVQRTAVNTECKFLLLGYAFEQLECIAVEFRTHFFNRQSRAGIERLGAKLDGILRQHQLTRNGTLRDTCVYGQSPLLLSARQVQIVTLLRASASASVPRHTTRPLYSPHRSLCPWSRSHESGAGNSHSRPDCRLR